ncbi:LytTR family DNA-binding domain-containing protein [Mongoliimonas terrestris]|uniref:LytTR family DNA-binding domain-containing protein n=1 Tax=Mongoliimonas terrestris TaxID=1709001 RepID=UPI0009496B9E|nr:LytTR family DNA-binding domain-containing protein [Mongoliimonas terrestris]
MTGIAPAGPGGDTRPADGTPEPARIGWGLRLALHCAGLTLALTWIGPSASDGLGTLNAMVFWAAHVVPALALLAFVQVRLARVRRIGALPGLAQTTLTAVVGSLVFTPLALLIDRLFGAAGSVDPVALPIVVRAGAEFAVLVVPFVLVWGLINAPSLMTVAATRPTDADDRPDGLAASDDVAAFRARIPRRLGWEIIALSAELHYLRVYTTRGNTLILFPFGRALDLLSHANGIQVHRSHWISLDHVDAVVTRDGRTVCTMIDGPNLPVSRSRRSALRQAMRQATKPSSKPADPDALAAAERVGAAPDGGKPAPISPRP